jgi:cytochrome b561
MRNEPIVIYCDRELMDSYSRPARLLHWLTAILLVGSFGLGLSMTRFIGDDQKLRVYSWHEWVGITIFLATIARLVWRLLHRPPPLDLPWIERVGAGFVYVAMYCVLLVQPIVGWLMSTAFGFPVVYLGLLPLPQVVEADRDLAARFQSIHFGLAMLLLGLFVAHMGGVLFHHLIKQDGILRRMLPGQARRATTMR